MSKSWLLAMIGCALLIAGLATWSPVALVVLVVGVSVAVLAWLRPFYLLALLILTLPVHVFAMRFGVGQLGLSSDFMDKLAFWKEGVMLILIAVLAIRRLVKRDGFRVPLYLFDLGVACVALLMGVYVLVAPRLGIGVYGFRNYLEPLIPFYLLRFTSVTRRDLRNLLAGMMLVSMVIAVFGIYQANFWTFRDLYDWGFRDANGKIPDAFYMAIVERQPRLRAVSTVTSPNELGLILMQTIILSVVLLLPRERPGWQRVALTGLITVTGLCLLFTFWRSGI
ncbi:MAG: hypothetical protein CVU38_18790 [Chloroflexi bacterium HGW-Chloroflexi-1]|nr:MAG: hypothetical protein CVU38_18790 [Chloroflexi bacterium HGW-Chloroflexi-1]